MTETDKERADRLEEAIKEAWVVMNYLGDVLNGQDMVEHKDENVCNPSWQKVRELAPFVNDVDLEEVYRSRHKESIGTCFECGQDIQWCDAHELLSVEKKRCSECLRTRISALNNESR